VVAVAVCVAVAVTASVAVTANVLVGDESGITVEDGSEVKVGETGEGAHPLIVAAIDTKKTKAVSTRFFIFRLL